MLLNTGCRNCPLSGDYYSMIITDLRAHARERQAFINKVYGARRGEGGGGLHRITPHRTCHSPDLYHKNTRLITERFIYHTNNVFLNIIQQQTEHKSCAAAAEAAGSCSSEAEVVYSTCGLYYGSPLQPMGRRENILLFVR